MTARYSRSSNAVAVRQAKAADVARIVHMLWDDEQGRRRESTLPENAGTYLSAFEQIERDPNSHVFVATLDDVVVGCLQLTILPGLSYRGTTRALIEDVRVAKSSRGQGIGSHLLSFAEARAADLGCSMIELFVHDSRSDAHRFYETAGYSGVHRGFRKKLG